MPVDHRTIPIELLDRHDRNYRGHPESQISNLMESLRAFDGQVRSIVVKPIKGGHYTILAGHGITEAAKRLGLSEMNCDVVPEHWTDIQCLAYLKADNMDGAEDDMLKVASLLEEVRNDGAILLEALGSSNDKLDQLLEELANQALGFDENGEMPKDVDSEPLIFSKEAIIESAFNYFREFGFPYRKLPIHVCMQEINKLSNTDYESLSRTDTALQVADTYNPHRFHAHADGMKSPFQAFNDDKLLRRALGLEIEKGNISSGYFSTLNIVSGTQACSNFRPGFAARLYRDYCKPGAVVLDTSTGYGGRLIGFMASGIAGKYIGIDPNVPTFEGNMRMAKELGFVDKVELYNLPAEDMPHDKVSGRCDFAFTSPPYFAKEHYSEDETQSWVRYKTGEDWRQGFLIPMLKLQHTALKPGGAAIVNIADVTVRNKNYPLVDWTIQAGKEIGFNHIRTDKFEMTRRFGAGMDDEVAYEPVIVFRKPL